VLANDATEQTLARLAEFRAEGARVLSLYVSFDPTEVQTPEARRSRVESLLADAERRYADDPQGASRDAQMALRADIERVRAFFANGEFTPKAARGVAVFCSQAADLLEVVKLPRPVEATVVVDDSPFIEPLLAVVAHDVWCVVLSDRRSARIFVGPRDGLSEIAQLKDDVHRWHARGGRSQKRFQRGIEKEVHDHLKHTAQVLFELARQEPYEHLIVGASQELWRELEDALHPDVRERIAGRVELDVGHATTEDVARASLAVMDEWAHGREGEALARLAQELGRGGRAAAGVDDVLAALTERRVEQLLTLPNLHRAGVACPACGLLALGGAVCPADGSALQPREDVIEDGIELALAQGADVLVVSAGAQDLEARGGLAALLRY